jgi:hypothetical protein
MLANDMAERIKANRAGTDAGEVTTTYDLAVPLGTPAGDGSRFRSLATSCITTNCTTELTVLFDAAMWDGLLAGDASEKVSGTATGIGPLISPRGCVQTLSTTACACAGAPGSRQVIYRVSVAWQGNYATESPEVAAAENTCGRGVYMNPATGAADEAFRRLVAVDVYTVLPCACPL